MHQKEQRQVISRIWTKRLSVAVLVCGLVPITGNAQGSISIIARRPLPTPIILPPTVPQPPAPPNDNFANATELGGNYVTVQGTNVAATAEAGESASHSVWWKWTAPGDGIVELQTRIIRGPFRVITPIYPTPYDSVLPPPGVTPEVVGNLMFTQVAK